MHDTEPTGATPRILAVDGDRAGARLLAASVCAALSASGAGEARVRTACDGRDASMILRESQFDIVLADLASLHDLSPLIEEAVGKLARLSGEALLIALSAGSSVSAAVAAMRAGAHDCLARPLDEASLVARIAGLAMRFGRPLIGGKSFTQLAPSLAANSTTTTLRSRILPMWQQEQKIIEDAIASYSGNIAMAAAALEISPSTIYRKRLIWAEMSASAA